MFVEKKLLIDFNIYLDTDRSKIFTFININNSNLQQKQNFAFSQQIQCIVQYSSLYNISNNYFEEIKETIKIKQGYTALFYYGNTSLEN